MSRFHTPTLLAALREGTAGLHEAVERLPALRGLVEGDLDLERYLAILQRF